MLLHEVRALAVDLMSEHLDTTVWSFEFDSSKRRAGACHHGPKKITLSRDLMALWAEADVRNTILHEIAHAMVGHKHGHDGVWRRTAVAIGCTGDRCYSADMPSVAAPWVGTCPNGHEAQRHRRPTKQQSCGRCSRRFDRRFLITWKHNGRPFDVATGRYVAVEAPALPVEAPKVAASTPAPTPRPVAAPGVPRSVQCSLF